MRTEARRVGSMYGRILRQLREARGRSQAEIAKTVEISAAHLARLEAGQRGLYVRDFVRIAEALGEKPGNLLPNDVGSFGHVKPLVDRLAGVPAEILPHVTAILTNVVVLVETMGSAAKPPARKRKPLARPASRKKGRK